MERQRSRKEVPSKDRGSARTERTATTAGLNGLFERRGTINGDGRNVVNASEDDGGRELPREFARAAGKRNGISRCTSTAQP